MRHALLALSLVTLPPAERTTPDVATSLQQFRAGQIGRSQLSRSVHAAAHKRRLSDADLQTLVQALDEGDEVLKQAVVWSLVNLKRSDGKDVLKAVCEQGPKLVSRSAPIYPSEARSKRIQGSVQYEVLLDSSGRVAEVGHLLRSIPPLDNAAREALKGWSFAPARRHGVAVPYVTVVSVDFRLP